MVLLVLARGGRVSRGASRPVLIGRRRRGTRHRPSPTRRKADAAAFWARVSVIGAGRIQRLVDVARVSPFPRRGTGVAVPALRARAPSGYFSVAFTVGALLDLYFEAGLRGGPDPHARWVGAPTSVLLICLVFAPRPDRGDPPLRPAIRCVYRIKFVLLGIGAIAASHNLRLQRDAPLRALAGHRPGSRKLPPPSFPLPSWVSASSAAGCATRSSGVAISPQMVHGSLTVLVVGLYLLAVGAGGALIRISGIAYGGAIREGGRVRRRPGPRRRGVLAPAPGWSCGGWFARHFLRSRYDYRTKNGGRSPTYSRPPPPRSRYSIAFSSSSARLLPRAASPFGCVFDADQRYHRIRSVNTEAPLAPRCRPSIRSWPGSPRPTSPCPPTWRTQGRRSSWPPRAAALCIPITAGHELIAFIALSAPPRGESYGDDDRDLLRAIARHAAVLLAHARLGEGAPPRPRSWTPSIVSRRSACTTSRTWRRGCGSSRKNAAVHGDDPAFREAATRTVEHTAREMSSLIAKLSLRSPVGRGNEKASSSTPFSPRS